MRLFVLSGLSILFLGFIFLPAGQHTDRNLLQRFYIEKMNHQYWLTRVDGMAGLAHIRENERVEIPELLNHTESESEFEQLISLWALAKISYPGNNRFLQNRAFSEMEKLEEGSFREVAARAAFLAAFDNNQEMLSLLDRILPDLYNAARSNNLEKLLIASRALYEIDTQVTKETADRALKKASAELNPDHALFTRHLMYIRLVGAPGKRFFTEKLKSIINNHDFNDDLFSAKAQTVRTLVELLYPEEPELLTLYREQLAERLQHPLQDAAAFSDLMAVGPHACSGSIKSILKADLQGSDDGKARQDIQQALLMCGT